MRIIRADGEILAEIADDAWRAMFSDDQASVLRAWAGEQPEAPTPDPLDRLAELPAWAFVAVAFGFFGLVGWLIWVIATH